MTQFFSMTRGGGESVFNLIAKSLGKNGHNVWVITNKIIGEDYSIDKNVKIIFVPPQLEHKGGIPPSFSDNIKYLINTITSGLKIIKNEHIDLIHSNNFSPALAGSILSLITSKPHIIAVHDIFSLCGKKYWEKWRKQNNVSRINAWLAPSFEKFMVKLKHKCIHTVSEATKDDLLKFGAKKQIYVIHNSIEADLVKTEKININQFVFVGRLVFYKNLEVVIKAIEKIKKIEPGIRLIIVGDGPHRENLEKISKKLGLEHNIEFKGYIDNLEKNKIIASSNAMVFPSLCEGFGLVILEAFAQSKPVLVSNLRPMSDIISNRNNGFVLNPYDENSWAEHILELIKNPNLSDSMGKVGNKALQNYSQQSMYRQIIKMYEDNLRQ